MPFLTNRSLTHMTQIHYYLIPIDEHFEQLKKSFSPLVLLPPPPVNASDDKRMMEANKISELDKLFDQPPKRVDPKK